MSQQSSYMTAQERGRTNHSRVPSSSWKNSYLTGDIAEKHSIVSARHDRMQEKSNCDTVSLKESLTGCHKFIPDDARFTVAYERDNAYAALLVTEKLISSLNDTFQKKRELDALQGPLFNAISDIQKLERAVEDCLASLERENNQDISEGPDQRDHQDDHDHLTMKRSELREAQHRRDILQQRHDSVQAENENYRNYTDYVLETAMDAANILRPCKPITMSMLYGADEDEEEPNEGRPKAEAGDNASSIGEMSPRSIEISEIYAHPSELLRRAAYENYQECSDELGEINNLFNNKEFLYEEQLAEYLQGSKEGAYDFTRSEFDRRSLKYHQDLTRALINIEEAYDKAQEQARALGWGDEASFVDIDPFVYEESAPDDEVARYAASFDRDTIEAWRTRIPESAQVEIEELEDVEEVVDDFAADLVDMSDSASVMDLWEYRRQIDQWQKIRGVFEGPIHQRTGDVWTKGGRQIQRRYSR